MPSVVTGRVGFLDLLATRTAQFPSRARFLAGCVVVVVIWTPTNRVIGSIDTWQLLINTLTTIVTFLIVALLQNGQPRPKLQPTDGHRMVQRC
jgi:low affinity Fe/Cu permease